MTTTEATEVAFQCDVAHRGCACDHGGLLALARDTITGLVKKIERNERWIQALIADRTAIENQNIALMNQIAAKNALIKLTKEDAS